MRKLLIIFGTVTLILVAWLILNRDERLLTEDIQKVSIYKGQGAGKIIEGLYLGDIQGAQAIDTFQDLLSRAKKLDNQPNTTPLSDYDMKVTTSKGEEVILHFYVHGTDISIMKTVLRNGQPYISGSFEIRGEGEKLLELIQAAGKD